MRGENRHSVLVHFYDIRLGGEITSLIWKALPGRCKHSVPCGKWKAWIGRYEHFVPCWLDLSALALPGSQHSGLVYFHDIEPSGIITSWKWKAWIGYGNIVQPVDKTQDFPIYTGTQQRYRTNVPWRQNPRFQIYVYFWWKRTTNKVIPQQYRVAESSPVHHKKNHVLRW